MRQASAWVGRAMPLAGASPSGGSSVIWKREGEMGVDRRADKQKRTDCFVLCDCKPRGESRFWSGLYTFDPQPSWREKK